MFEKFRSISRLNKEVIVTEKIDGTNAQVHIVDEEEAFVLSDETVPYLIARNKDRGLFMFAGSRQRYITPDKDNFGFAQWVEDNADELFKFGPGRHYGEWWGQGIQRTYDLDEKRFSMFNPKWMDQGPSCVHTVPVLEGLLTIDAEAIEGAMRGLKIAGSVAAPGFKNPEGVVVYHTASNTLYKQTFDFDEGKWSA